MNHTKEDIKKIANYIKQEQKEGYSVPQLRRYLVSKGYESGLIDEAIDSLYSRWFNFTDGEKKILFLVVVIIAFFGVASLGYFLVFNNSNFAQIPINNNQNGDIGKEIDFTNNGQQNVSITNNNNEFDNNNTSTNQQDIQKNNQQSTPTTPNNKIDSNKPCKEIEDTSRRDQCYLSEAYSDNKFELCGKIINTGKQNLCRSMGRTQDKLNSNNLAFEFSSGEVKPLDQTDGDALLLEDYLNLQAEVVQ